MSANQKVLGELVKREVIVNVSSLIEHFMFNPGSLDGSEYNYDDLLELSESYDYTEDYSHEALEFWAVSRWFAEKLAEKGEAVGELFGLNIWGRATSGQAILLDSVIEEIGRDMEILEGQANHKYWI